MLHNHAKSVQLFWNAFAYFLVLVDFEYDLV